MSVEPLSPEEIDAIRATHAEGKAAYEAKDSTRMSVSSALLVAKIPSLLATLDAKDAEIARLIQELEELRRLTVPRKRI